MALLKEHISWMEAWQLKSFRNKTFVALALVAIILLLLPSFFAFIEKREGMVLQDFVLERLPATDVSIPTFIIIWSVVLLVFYRIYQNPIIFLVVAYGFILMCLARVLTISLLPLNPPPGLITLKDPIANIAYGGKGIFITKDLFYSGHTGNMFLFFLCLQAKWDKIIALAASFMVGILVLIQHIHYSIDVISAFIFTYFLYLGAKKVAFF
ncbi:MAG: phosphatase PAP2-related protein [Bacteroidetes bacterium]|nr:phosphatase PAP2-related protein [Bacteroidota bacterium]